MAYTLDYSVIAPKSTPKVSITKKETTKTRKRKSTASLKVVSEKYTSEDLLMLKQNKKIFAEKRDDEYRLNWSSIECVNLQTRPIKSKAPQVSTDHELTSIRHYVGGAIIGGKKYFFIPGKYYIGEHPDWSGGVISNTFLKSIKDNTTCTINESLKRQFQSEIWKRRKNELEAVHVCVRNNNKSLRGFDKFGTYNLPQKFFCD